MNNDKCCCSEKIKERSDEEKKYLINRLNRIEGQINGIKKMIESDRYCVDILVQSSAVSKAFLAFAREVFRRHLKSCVVEDIRKGNDEIIDETVDIVERLMR